MVNSAAVFNHRYWELLVRTGNQTLMHWAGSSRPGIKLDLTKRALVVRHVLLQNCRQRLGLLRAEINALKISHFHLIFGLLLHGAENQEKIPDIHSNLHAVGVGFPVIRSIGNGKIRLRGDDHGAPSVTEPEPALPVCGDLESDQAGMAELADALDLGSSAERRAGSSPVPGTNCEISRGSGISAPASRFAPDFNLPWIQSSLVTE